MIFVTVGTHQQPFDRLLGALPRLGAEELVVQCGYGHPPAGIAAVPFMPFEDIVAGMRRAERVVTHAGVGTVLLAIRYGHTPVVVPRLRRHAEHVDDHQVEFTRALADLGRVVPLWDVDDLPSVVAAAPSRGDSRVPRPVSLHASVRAALEGRPVPPPAQ